MKNFLEMQYLNKDYLHSLGTVYAENVHFIDRAQEIYGLEKVIVYFSGMYQNIESMHFTFYDVLETRDEEYVQRDMTFIHQRQAGARPIAIGGVIFLRTGDDGKVIYHRDYIALGAMVYEQVSQLGRVITAIKRRLRI